MAQRLIDGLTKRWKDTLLHKDARTWERVLKRKWKKTVTPSEFRKKKETWAEGTVSNILTSRKRETVTVSRWYIGWMTSLAYGCTGDNGRWDSWAQAFFKNWKCQLLCTVSTHLSKSKALAVGCRQVDICVAARQPRFLAGVVKWLWQLFYVSAAPLFRQPSLFSSLVIFGGSSSSSTALCLFLAGRVFFYSWVDCPLDTRHKKLWPSVRGSSGRSSVIFE